MGYAHSHQPFDLDWFINKVEVNNRISRLALLPMPLSLPPVPFLLMVLPSMLLHLVDRKTFLQAGPGWAEFD